MKAVVSLTTAAAVLLHLLLGCCGHHAHGVEGARANEAGVCAHHSSCQHEAEDHSRSDEGKSPAREAPCDEADCIFGVGATYVPAPPEAVELLAILPAVIVEELSSFTVLNEQICANAVSLHPPLRAHVLHQVFLN